MIKFMILFAITALTGYILGYFVGRLTAEQEFKEKRRELGLDEEEKEADPYDALFKQ